MPTVTNTSGFTPAQQDAIKGVSSAFQGATPGGYSQAQQDAISGVASSFPAPAPITPVAPPTPVPQPMTSVYGPDPYSNANINTASQAASDFALKGLSPEQEAQTRASTLAAMQAEIDTQNTLYADKLAQAKITGANRLGSTISSEYRSGAANSNFGNAQTDTTNNANNTVYNAINNEKAAAIAAIRASGENTMQKNLAAKTVSQQAGLDAYVKHLQDSSTRSTSGASAMAKILVANKQDPSLVSANDLTAHGTTKGQLQAAYNDAKSVADEAAAKEAAAAQAATDTHNQAAATLAKPTGLPGTDNGFTFNSTTGKYEQTTSGVSSDAALKEYQYAVQNDGYKGTLQQWNAQKANAKVSIGASRDPITGALVTYNRTGPGVSGGSGGAGGGVSDPHGGGTPVSTATPTVTTTSVSDPFEKLSGSDLAYAQSGKRTDGAFKYPGQIDAAEKRIRAAIPGWTPGDAAAQYTFFKSAATQTFIANSNTVLNTINDPVKGIKALSAKVDRGNLVLLNNGTLALKTGVSDENAALLVQQAQIAGDEAGKLLGSAGGSDFTTQLGLSLINPNYSDATFKKTMDNLAGRITNKVSEYYKQAGKTDPNATTTGGTFNAQHAQTKYNY